MKASELLSYEIEHIGSQLRKVFEGLQPGYQDFRVTAKAMSPRDSLEHLCEVYQAVVSMSAGKEHEWGSFSIDDKSWDNLWSTMWRMRGDAVAAVSGSDDDKTLKAGHDYIVSHEAYHVGQAALVRLATDADWNPYSIYEH
jgi:hypothetical protein